VHTLQTERLFPVRIEPTLLTHTNTASLTTSPIAKPITALYCCCGCYPSACLATHFVRAQHAAHCNTLQHTTIRCTTLEHTKNKIPSTGTPCDRLCAYTHCNALRQNCNALQHTAAHCSTLQHTATLQAHLVTDIVPTHAATHCNTTATQCSTLQHTTTHCNTLQHTATHSAYYSSCRHLLRQTLCTHTHCNARQHIATHCNMLRHPAAHCNTHYHSKNTIPSTGAPCDRFCAH